MQIVFSWKAVAWATAAGWVLYVLWFSPYLFGGAWQRLEQLADEEVRAGIGVRLLLALVASAVQALCLEGFFNFTHSGTLRMGALAGLQLSLGLVAPACVLLLLMGGRKPALIGVYLGWIVLSQVAAGGLLAVLS